MINSEPKELVCHLTQEMPINATQIRAGRNSRVFRVDCESGQTLLVKFYLQPTADGLSRLEQEWSALKFMNESGIKNIPSPLRFDESAQGAIYSFIHGNSIKNGTDQDIRGIHIFFSQLKKISNQQSTLELPRAAEACFSPAELVGNIKQRLNQLHALPAEENIYQHMHLFLEKQFSPEFERCINTAKQNFPYKLWLKPLPPKVRILSPSDFGFHNALRTDNGLAFVDFEYFGWDDPVKTTSDFLLHPAMNLTNEQQIIFFSGMQNLFANDKNFMQRFKTYLPLFRLKWCMILLNEFLNQHIKRREFAAGEIADHNNLRAQQLEKAENFLNKDQEILTALNLRN